MTVELCDKIDCTACGACINSCTKEAISMHRDEEGFAFPVINEDLCNSCGLCRRVCPILTPPVEINTVHPQVVACWSLNDGIRTTSSSGGVFTELAKVFINNGGFVYGAAFDEHFHLKHCGVDNITDLAKLKESKYLQSDIGNSFKEIRNVLRNGKSVLFVGTPCQIAGLKNFLRKDYENLIAVDLVCHGVPSPSLFEKYRKRLMECYGVKCMDSFSFRDVKGRSHQLSFVVNGKKKIIDFYGNRVVYLTAFMKNLLQRESCFRCPFARIPRQGDLTLGDFWGLGKKTPFRAMENTAHGTSLILINSAKGNSAFDMIKSSLFYEYREIEEAIAENRNIVAPSERPDQRDTFYQDFDKLTFAKLAKKYRLKRKLSVVGKIKYFIIRILKIKR